MANGIFVATSGTVAQLRRMEVISNNLANARSPGFKADRIIDQGVVAPNAKKPRVQGDRGQPNKRYAETVDTRPMLESGSLSRTDNPLDLALTGNAFLRVETSRGERLTRNGRLALGRDGVLRTTQGHAVLGPKGRPVRLPPGRVPEIDSRGRVASGPTYVTQLGIAHVDLKGGLTKDLEGLFVPPKTFAMPDAEAGVAQGHIEESNVQPVRMMLDLIQVQRNFSALNQVITAYGEMDDQAMRLDN